MAYTIESIKSKKRLSFKSLKAYNQFTKLCYNTQNAFYRNQSDPNEISYSVPLDFDFLPFCVDALSDHLNNQVWENNKHDVLTQQKAQEYFKPKIEVLQ